MKTREAVIAGTGVGTESVVIPYVLRNLMGLKFKVIAGFPGGSEMNLALARGEVDGRGTFSWTVAHADGKPHHSHEAFEECSAAMADAEDFARELAAKRAH